MGDLINLQVIISQAPHVSQIQSASTDLVPNGAQIISVVQAEKYEDKKSKVLKILASNEIKNENRKNGVNTPDNFIDIHV